VHKKFYTRTVEALLGTIDDSAGDEAMLRDVLRLLVDNPAASSSASPAAGCTASALDYC
jgi:hypothetical protein